MANDEDTDAKSASDQDKVPEPQGRFAGVPYDFRRPTVDRLRSRWWNPADHRFFTPKTFGAGWDLNLYWVAHPSEYLGHHSPTR